MLSVALRPLEIFPPPTPPDPIRSALQYVVTGAYVCAIIAWVLAFLWVCLFCFLAKRISLAIGVIKEAGRAIARMPLIVLWPVFELVRVRGVDDVFGSSESPVAVARGGGGGVAFGMPFWRYSIEHILFPRETGWWGLSTMITTFVVANAYAVWNAIDSATLGLGMVLSPIDPVYCY